MASRGKQVLQQDPGDRQSAAILQVYHHGHRLAHVSRKPLHSRWAETLSAHLRVRKRLTIITPSRAYMA